MKDENEENGPIKINDHRRFNPDGSLKADLPPETPRAEPISASEPEPLSSEPPAGSGSPHSSSSSPMESNFANFILSLAGSAQMNLGLIPNPYTQEIEKDLDQAKQTIDLLGMLQEKTRGNLNPQEAQLLEVVLSDLRLRFVEEKKNAK